MKIHLLLLLLIVPFAFAEVTWVPHDIDGNTIYYHDYETFCSYTEPCNEQIYEDYVNTYIEDMTIFINEEQTIATDVVQSQSVISSNYFYASAGVYVSNYAEAVQDLLNLRTYPSGDINKESYPNYLTESIMGQPVLNTGKTVDFLLHLLAENYRQQQTILEETCSLPQAVQRLSWCQR